MANSSPSGIQAVQFRNRQVQLPTIEMQSPPISPAKRSPKKNKSPVHPPNFLRYSPRNLLNLHSPSVLQQKSNRSCDPCLKKKKACNGAYPCKRCSDGSAIEFCKYAVKLKLKKTEQPRKAKKSSAGAVIIPDGTPTQPEQNIECSPIKSLEIGVPSVLLNSQKFKRSCDKCVKDRKQCSGGYPCNRCLKLKSTASCKFSFRKRASKTCRKLCLQEDEEKIKDVAYWKQKAIDQSLLCQKWKTTALKFKGLHMDLLKKRNAKRISYRRQKNADKKKTRSEVRKFIEEKIGSFGEDNRYLSKFLAHFVYFLPKDTIANFFHDLDRISCTNKKGIKTMKQPLLHYVYEHHLTTVRRMEQDPYFATLLYVLRKELELGQKRGAMICRMLFRDNSMAKTSNKGRGAYLPLEYGWGFFDKENQLFQTKENSLIGITFPRFSINKESDKKARKYIREQCTFLPKVLSEQALKELFFRFGIDESFAESNVAVINVFEAVDMLAKLGVEVCWQEFTWFKKYSSDPELPPSTDYKLFSLLFGVDAFPLYDGLFSRKGVTSFSLALGNTPGLTNRPEWTIPIALVEGKESDPLVQGVARLMDLHFLSEISNGSRPILFQPPAECTIKADAFGNTMPGIQKCKFRLTTRSDQAGLAVWAKCAPPGSRYGLAAAQVEKDELKIWEIMIHNLNGHLTRAFISFETRNQMAAAYNKKADELRPKYSTNTLIDHLLSLAAKDVDFGGHSQVYGFPFGFMLYFLLCVLHIDNNECKTVTNALIDASIRRYQNRTGISVNRNVDHIDFEDLDIFFHGDDIDNLNPQSSLQKLLNAIEHKVQPKMVEVIKKMMSSEKRERQEARSIRFIGSISQKCFLAFPDLVDCLKDENETAPEKAYREQLYLQVHLLRCLSSAYHKGCMHRGFDDEGLLFLGLQYHKLCCLCDLDLTHNAYNACKIVPFMCFEFRDIFTPDLDSSVFFGPGLCGIMQAIEHLNKQLKSKMHTWTSGKKKFLVSFLQNVYEVLLGKYVALKIPLKPSYFFAKKMLCSKGIQDGFRFPSYKPSDPGMCFPCRRVFTGTALRPLKVLRAELLEKDPVMQKFCTLLGTSIPIPKCYVDDGTGSEIKCKLKSSTAITVQDFQTHFQLFEMDKPCCEDCLLAYKMSCILLCETMQVEDLSEASLRAVQVVRKEGAKVLVPHQVARRKKMKK